MEALLYVLVAFALLMTWPYAKTFWHMLQLTHCFPNAVPQQVDEIAEPIQQLCQPAIATLEQLGFTFYSYYTIKVFTRPPNNYEWRVLLVNESETVFVGLEVRPFAQSTFTLNATFSTIFNNHRWLSTTNNRRYGVVSPHPDVTTRHLESASLEILWQAHQEQLQQWPDTQHPRSLPPEAFIATSQALWQEDITRLTNKGEVNINHREQTYRFSFWISWQLFLKVVRRHLANATGPSGQPSSEQERSPASPTANLEQEVQTYLQNQAASSKPQLSNQTKTWLLLISMGVFAAVAANLFDGVTLIILVAAVLLHEGGHWLAMTLFGYQDATVFFIPGFGALATARKDDATLTQKFWVDLAGPLPGLLLGIALKVSPALSSLPGAGIASGILISLNLFNLLPIYPLDGGQIVNLLLFSQQPYLAVIFQSIGVLLLALMGLVYPASLVFALLVALGVFSTFQNAKVSTKIQRELKPLPSTISQEELLRSIFQAMNQAGYEQLPAVRRQALAKQLLERHQERQAKWVTRVFLILLYLGSLIGGIGGVVYSFIPNANLWLQMMISSRPQDPKTFHQSLMQQQIEQETQLLRSNPKNTRAYWRRAIAYAYLAESNSDSSYRQAALADYNQAIALEPNNLISYRGRAELHQSAKNYSAAIADYNYILGRNPQDVDTHLARATTRQRMGNLKGAIADLTFALRFNPSNWMLHTQRGELRYQAQDYRGALADANAAIKISPKLGIAFDLRSRIYRQLGNEKQAIADQKKATSWKISDDPEAEEK